MKIANKRMKEVENDVLLQCCIFISTNLLTIFLSIEIYYCSNCTDTLNFTSHLFVCSFNDIQVTSLHTRGRV